MSVKQMCSFGYYEPSLHCQKVATKSGQQHNVQALQSGVCIRSWPHRLFAV